MNLVTTLIALTIGFSVVAQAGVITTMVCKTEKGTELKLIYDNYSELVKGSELISLTIAGDDMSERLQNDHFGTTGGRPSFAVTEFPTAGKHTSFTISKAGTYTVYKNGSYSGEEHNLSCEDKTPKAEKEDSSF